MNTISQDSTSALSARAYSSNEFEKGMAYEISNGVLQRDPLPTMSAPEWIISEDLLPAHSERGSTKRDQKTTAAPVMNVTKEPSASNATNDSDLPIIELLGTESFPGSHDRRIDAQHSMSETELDELGENLEAAFRDTYVELVAAGVSDTLAQKFIADVIPDLRKDSTRQISLTRMALQRGIASMIRFEPDPLRQNAAATIALIGATGVGKTTTIAKLAARVSLYDHRPVELVTLDTYRIAAVEQLKTYARIIGAGCHVVHSVYELDTVLGKLPSEATVLIDTTGQSPHDLTDQYEISEFLLHRSNIRKCLTIQATTHPVEASAAIKKFEIFGIDCMAVAKMDETLRPGSVIETVAESGLPLAYFCVGQRVPEDLSVATARSLTDQILGKRRSTADRFGNY